IDAAESAVYAANSSRAALTLTCITSVRFNEMNNRQTRDSAAFAGLSICTGHSVSSRAGGVLTAMRRSLVNDPRPAESLDVHFAPSYHLAHRCLKDQYSTRSTSWRNGPSELRFRQAGLSMNSRETT